MEQESQILCSTQLVLEVLSVYYICINKKTSVLNISTVFSLTQEHVLCAVIPGKLVLVVMVAVNLADSAVIEML